MGPLPWEKPQFSSPEAVPEGSPQVVEFLGREAQAPFLGVDSDVA